MSQKWRNFSVVCPFWKLSPLYHYVCVTKKWQTVYYASLLDDMEIFCILVQWSVTKRASYRSTCCLFMATLSLRVVLYATLVMQSQLNLESPSIRSSASRNPGKLSTFLSSNVTWVQCNFYALVLFVEMNAYIVHSTTFGTCIVKKRLQCMAQPWKCIKYMHPCCCTSCHVWHLFNLWLYRNGLISSSVGIQQTTEALPTCDFPPILFGYRISY